MRLQVYEFLSVNFQGKRGSHAVFRYCTPFPLWNVLPLSGSYIDDFSRGEEFVGPGEFYLWDRLFLLVFKKKRRDFL